MPIPDYQTLMLPLLCFLADGDDHTTREAIEALADKFNLSHEERTTPLPSGRQPIFANRVSWAATYLRKAGLVEAPRRGMLRITTRGKEVLSETPPRVDLKYLERFPEFVEFRSRSRERADQESAIEAKEQTPEELLGLAYQRLRENLSQDLLSRVLSCSPEFFERLVVELLVKMGYGGSRLDAGKRIGQSGDGGVDGVIKEDPLGLDTIYIQAKRWQGAVGRPEIQKFVGALQGQRTKKGVFITTSSFTQEAIDYASRITDSKVILIDGQQLADLMIEHDVGVSPVTAYVIKRIDSDFFEDDNVGL